MEVSKEWDEPCFFFAINKQHNIYFGTGPVGMFYLLIHCKTMRNNVFGLIYMYNVLPVCILSLSVSIE
jgi:hypothetical protein